MYLIRNNAKKSRAAVGGPAPMRAKPPAKPAALLFLYSARFSRAAAQQSRKAVRFTTTTEAPTGVERR